MKNKWTFIDILVLCLEISIPIISIVITCAVPQGRALDSDIKLAIIGGGISIPIVLLQISVTVGQNSNDRCNDETKTEVMHLSEQLNHISPIIATNLVGSIALLKIAVPYMRKQGGGRLIQMSSYGGQVAYAANSMYHATKFGIEGFCESLAQEVAQFNIGVTIVEPGGARTEFRYGSAKVAKLMPEYESCHGFLNMLDPANGLAPGDPAKMAQRIIESTEKTPAPLRMVLGSQALSATIQRLSERIADYETQKELAASTDIAEQHL